MIDASIIDAMDSVWRPWFARGDWSAWRALLKALFGLPLDGAELEIFHRCTGRAAPPPGGFLVAWLVIGRRGGKSIILAVVACFLACFRDWSPFLAPGERGVVMVIATDRKQARVIFRYCRALLTQVPALAALVERIDGETIDLVNGISIEIATASFRSVRGYTVIAALCDEIAFWRTEETAANPDAEIIAALRPAMTTVPGAMLLCASSPYARRGELYSAHREHFGKDDAEEFVWQASTLTMHPTVRRSIIDKAYRDDPASAAAEYGAEFRSDLEAYVAREVVDAATVTGRHELPPASGVSYVGAADPAGGSGSDSMTLSISHREKDGRAILDAVRERKPPFSPEAVVAEFATLLKSYRVRKVTGDHWGGEFVREPFRKLGIEYVLAEQPKSDFYRDALPLLNSGKAELLDLPRLSAQLCGLERRTARSGKDSIDHAPGGHDDVANCVSLGIVLAAAEPAVMRVSPEALAWARGHPGPSRAYAPRGDGQMPCFFPDPK